MSTLFDSTLGPRLPVDLLGPGTAILNGFALRHESDMEPLIQAISKLSPFRHMITPGGFRMSVALTNCGKYGWVSDRKGYRYDAIDPETRQHWPGMPENFRDLAKSAASAAGFPSFDPDACLINRYEPGSRLTLHQDKNERDFTQPTVSVSLGLPATFLFGGVERSYKTLRIPIHHGDVLVWGGPARLRYHGINPLKEGVHPTFGRFRYNLTFRTAGPLESRGTIN
jgi:alkylated DNA repair protein (DNA oxidative demethylase)